MSIAALSVTDSIVELPLYVIVRLLPTLIEAASPEPGRGTQAPVMTVLPGLAVASAGPYVLRHQQALFQKLHHQSPVGDGFPTAALQSGGTWLDSSPGGKLDRAISVVLSGFLILDDCRVDAFPLAGIALSMMKTVRSGAIRLTRGVPHEASKLARVALASLCYTSEPKGQKITPINASGGDSIRCQINDEGDRAFTNFVQPAIRCAIQVIWATWAGVNRRHGQNTLIRSIPV